MSDVSRREFLEGTSAGLAITGVLHVAESNSPPRRTRRTQRLCTFSSGVNLLSSVSSVVERLRR